MAVLESSEVRLVVDLSIPTDRQLTERRPDLVAYYWELRRIVVYEIEYAWEPLIEDQQREILIHSMNTNCESMAYRSFSLVSEKLPQG